MPVLRLDRHLYLTVRPTALEPRAALSGIIVDYHVQDVLAGLAERDCGRRLPTKHACGLLAGYVFHCWPCPCQRSRLKGGRNRQRQGKSSRAVKLLTFDL